MRVRVVLIFLLAVVIGLGAGVAAAQEAPTVVATVPSTGAQNVSPTLTDIHITFSQPMDRRTFSFVPVGCGLFPKIIGPPRFKGPNTLVVTVRLEPGTQYCLGINDRWHHGFKSTHGLPAIPHVLSFRTAGPRRKIETPIRPWRRPLDTEELVRRTFRATVLVRTNKGLGSGFIIDPDGYVVTNHHVIRGALWRTVKIRFKSGARTFLAKVVQEDTVRDLAVLKIDVKRKLPILPMGDSSKINVGERVIAIGNPVGLETTVTEGIVSAVRNIRGGVYIQTSAAINPGNSGGPLINKYGEVIGVNTWIIRRHKRRRLALEGLNFAVPINYVKPLFLSSKGKGARREFAGRTSFPVAGLRKGSPGGGGQRVKGPRREFSGAVRLSSRRRAKPQVVPQNVPIIGQIVFCQGVTLSGVPIRPGNTFKGGTTSVTAIFTYKNLPKKFRYRELWLVGGKVVRTVPGVWGDKVSGLYQTTIKSRSGAALRSGEWRFEFYLRGRLMASAEFTVK